MIAFIDFAFLNFAFALLIVGFLINTIEDYLPLCIEQNFRYGKFSYSGSSDSVLKLTELPKSYFKHFYAIATILVTSTFIFTFNMYYTQSHAPSWLVWFLDLCCGSDRTPIVSPAATTISLGLLMIQCFRRFYETFFVQVFAKTSKINLSHYIVGHFHYFGCVVAILGRSVGFTKEQTDVSRLFDGLTLIMITPTILLFSFAWLNQFQSNIILANLRKDKNSNKVISQKYFLPTGGWFEYVSSPHQLCEILIYIALTFLLMKNFSWICVLAWVVSNQVETALLSHWWYKKTFPKYPKQRRALIPFLI